MRFATVQHTSRNCMFRILKWCYVELGANVIVLPVHHEWVNFCLLFGDQGEEEGLRLLDYIIVASHCQLSCCAW